MKTVAITGGIGSGKSVVCEILRLLGYEVYDCDREAKKIMDENESIKLSIHEMIDPGVILWDEERSRIDRKRLADVVFKSKEKLECLNKIVHASVKEHLEKEISERGNRMCGKPFFFETAILFESKLNSIADEIWWVDAPKEIRLKRLEKRGMKYSDALARIESQSGEEEKLSKENPKIILNDGLTAVLPTIIKNLNQIQ